MKTNDNTIAKSIAKLEKFLHKLGFDLYSFDEDLRTVFFELFSKGKKKELANYLKIHNLNVSEQLKRLALRDIINDLNLISKTDAERLYTKEFIANVNLFLTFESPYKRNAVITMFFCSVLEKLWLDSVYSKKDNTKAKISAQKAVETKKNKMLSYVDGLKIEIKPRYKTREILLKLAIDSYYGNKQNCDSFLYFDGKFTNKSFEDRIMVNFVRHNLTDYGQRLIDLFGKVGKMDGLKLLRLKVYGEIGHVYPFLKKECERQYKDRHN